MKDLIWIIRILGDIRYFCNLFLNKYFTNLSTFLEDLAYFLAICLISIVYMLYLKFYYQLSMIQTPMPMVIVMTFVRIISILWDYIEILVRTYFEPKQATYNYINY